MRFAHRSDPKGFTLVEVLLVASLIAMLAVIAIHAIWKARLEAQEKNCLQNLRVLEDAVDQVMVCSNFQTTAYVNTTMLDEFMRRGKVAELNWPAEVEPPSDEVIQQSESNGLYVIFNDRELRLIR